MVVLGYEQFLELKLKELLRKREKQSSTATNEDIILLAKVLLHILQEKKLKWEKK